MMIKSRRIFLISSLCVGCFLLGNVFILSSCSTSSLLQMNPPSTPSQPSNPNVPSVTPPVNPPSTPSQPSNPNVPSVTPPVNPPVVPPVTPPIAPNPPDVLPPQQTTTINNDSLIIKGNKSHILPSMLLTEDKQNIDISKFDKKYGASITSETFKLVELDDTNGTISFEMNYQETNTKQQKKFLFSYSGLMKISSNLRINFIQSTNSFLNAYQYSQELLNPITKKSNNSIFYEFINKLSSEGGNKFSLLNNNNQIPLSYLKIDSLSVNGWKNTWFNSSDTLNLKYFLKNPRISFYKKITSDTNILEEQKLFPTDSNKEFTVKYYGAADYILNKIIVNETYEEQKTSDYYWGDCKFKNGLATGLNLTDSKWLSNYETWLKGTTTRYKATLANPISSNVEIDENKNLILGLKVKIENNDSREMYSSTTKKLIISNIQKLETNPFYSNVTNSTNKFMFKQKVDKLDTNLNNLKSDRDSVLNHISNKEGQIEITSALIKSKSKLIPGLISNMQMLFNNSELNMNNNVKDKYYFNDDIYVQNVDYNQNAFRFFYNKSSDVFQVKIKPSVSLSTIYTSNNYLTVNFTKPGASLTNLKK